MESGQLGWGGCVGGESSCVCVWYSVMVVCWGLGVDMYMHGDCMLSCSHVFMCSYFIDAISICVLVSGCLC